jgi:NAD(P)-dependent dehydrogenase (short-subunit alcohol dehydrogenase family)
VGARPRGHAPDGLLAMPILGPDAVPNPGAAQAMSKQANHSCVQAAAVSLGDLGARVKSISPGIILTPLGMSGTALRATGR